MDVLVKAASSEHLLAEARAVKNTALGSIRSSGGLLYFSDFKRVRTLSTDQLGSICLVGGFSRKWHLVSILNSDEVVDKLKPYLRGSASAFRNTKVVLADKFC